MEREMIVQALDERRLLTLSYGGGERVVQPHAILRKADGTELLEAYQLRGHSESGLEHGWKHFDITRINALAVEDERFAPRRDFRPLDGESGTFVATVTDN